MLALELGASPTIGRIDDTQAATQRAAISQALADSGLAQMNSSVSPDLAIANLATTRQAQWSFGIGVRLASAGPSESALPIASSGPLQGADPVSDSGPLHTMGPLQASGPLQGMGPLVSAMPLQNVGPVPIPEISNTSPEQIGQLVNLAPPGYQPPALSPVEIAALSSGDIATVNQVVAQLLASGNTSPETIQQIVDIISASPPTSLPSSISQPTGPSGSTSLALPSGQLPPTVFQPTDFVSRQ